MRRVISPTHTTMMRSVICSAKLVKPKIVISIAANSKTKQLGLYYLRARYMDTSTGSFTSMDTYAGSVFDPVSLHKYLYANANPVMNGDPSGYATERVADYGVGMTIMGIMAEASTSAASFALNFFYSFTAALPTIMAAATGFAAIMLNNPAFIDICSMYANGDITIWDVRDQIIQTCKEIKEQVVEWIQDKTNKISNNANRSGGNTGSPGNPNPNDPDFWKKVNDAASKVSDKYKKIFECDGFKDAFTRQLDKRGIDYKVIRVESNHGLRIVSDRLGCSIGDTGYHYGVKIDDIIYDNLNPGGISYAEWFIDLGGEEYIHVVP